MKWKRAIAPNTALAPNAMFAARAKLRFCSRSCIAAWRESPFGCLDADVVLSRDQRRREQRRDPEIGVVDRHARAGGLGRHLDLGRLGARLEQLARRLLHGLDQVLDA